VALPPRFDCSADASAVFRAQHVLVAALKDQRAVSDEELSASARCVFAAIQDALLGQAGEGAILRPGTRRDVYGAIEQVWAPIVDRYGKSKRYAGNKIAKEMQLEAVGDRPLAVCFGRPYRKINGSIQFASYGDGCGRVFVDESRVRFNLYCPDCRKKPGGRFTQEAIARAQAGAEGRYRVLKWDQEGNLVEVWRVPCRSCLEWFDTPQPRVRRCEPCRRGHRSPRTSVG
jgi:hypothetical protein